MILAIETSCDETALAVVDHNGHVLSNAIYSQIKVHQKYGGVIPEYASRMHTERIHHVLDEALDNAQTQLSAVTHIAVTHGPGLEGSLLVGLSLAKSLGHLLDIPVLGINHLHGHIYSAFCCDPPPQFPFICLIISGGHTTLIHVDQHFSFTILGQTRDDATGEAFDKVARALGLPYPGGPHVEKQAQEGNPNAFDFPRAMLHQGYEFSFSGLKTAVVQQLHALEEPYPVADICASFQASVADVLIHKCIKACQEHHSQHLVICGGVSANKTLRQAFQDRCDAEQISFYCPPFEYCTDNAAMIGVAAHYAIQTQDTPYTSPRVCSSLGL